ncbi:MAG: hypothetical protein ABR573_00205 [Candidatus Dormibacteria bacterium]
MLALLGLVLAACGTTVRPRPQTPSGTPVAVGRAYSFELSTHCGVLSIEFGGRPYYLDEPVPRTTAQMGLPNPIDTGMITLSTLHRAVFRDKTGHELTFVDRPPGDIGHAYTVPLQIGEGGRLGSINFNGRLWNSRGSLPESYGPSPGGVEPLKEVTGTVTLVDDGHAEVRYRGQVVQFVPSGPVFCM